MNRFYNVGRKEYTDPFQALPLEFMQGVAERKQKEFDVADLSLAGIPDQYKFNPIPGDANSYKEKIEAYNNQVLDLSEQLHQTGNSSKVAREVFKLRQKIANDSNLNVMKNAYEPWKKSKEESEKMDAETPGGRSPWQKEIEDFNSVTTQGQDGQHRARNFGVGFKTPEYNKDLKDSFGDVKPIITENGGTQFNFKDGTKIDWNTKTGIVDQDRITGQAKSALNLYSQTGSFKDHILEGNKLAQQGSITPENINNFAISKGLALLTSFGQRELQMDISTTENIHVLPSDYLDRFAPKPDPIYTQDQSLVTSPEAKYDEMSDLYNVTVKGGSGESSLTMGTSNSSGTIIKTPKTYNQLSGQIKKDFDNYAENFLNFQDPNLFKKIQSGEKQAGQYFAGFKAYTNALRKGLRSNTITTNVSNDDHKQLNNDLFGENADDVTLVNIQTGRGYNGETKIFKADGSPIKIKDIKGTDDSDKQYKFHINKVLGTHNPLYMASGRDPRFSTAYSLINQETGEQFFLPNNNASVNAINEAEVASSLYTPGVPTKIILRNAQGQKATFFTMYDKSTKSFKAWDKNRLPIVWQSDDSKLYDTFPSPEVLLKYMETNTANPFN